MNVEDRPIPHPKTTGAIGLLLPSAGPSVRLSAQSVDALAVRFAAMTPVTVLEEAMPAGLLAPPPGSIRVRAGTVRVNHGSGTPRRRGAGALGEGGYVVGNIPPDGYLTLPRGGPPPTPLFGQELEGDRVTVFGA